LIAKIHNNTIITGHAGLLLIVSSTLLPS